MNLQLYVITPIFNPQRFKSRARLYRNFAAHMLASGVQLITIEAAFGGHPFECTDASNPWHVQLRTDQLLWHKERLINLALPRLYALVPDAHNIGWFDADITFSNPDWAAEAVHRLMHVPVIQPFAEAINLNSSEEFMWKCPSSFASFLNERGYHQDPPLPLGYLFKGHPGLAWCATREALSALGGLFDTCAAGSGDTVMSNALKGGWDVYLPSSPSAGMTAAIKRWAARCDAFVRGRVGYTRGTVMHHWHGRSENRGYEKRWSILGFHQFDQSTDLILDAGSGLYRWAGNKPRLEDDIRLSLSSRNEDES
jgi:hypothetical protein